MLYSLLNPWIGSTYTQCRSLAASSETQVEEVRDAVRMERLFSLPLHLSSQAYADALGFREERSLRRALQRWTGLSVTGLKRKLALARHDRW